MDWWKARPLWQKVTIVVVGLLALGAVFGGDEDAPPATTVPIAAETTTTSTVATTTTTTTLATTSTTTALSIADQQMILAVVMDQSRSTLIPLLEDIFPMERVDTLSFDDHTTIVLDVTTSFASLQSDPAERSDDAWGLVQAWGAYFSGVFSGGDTFDPEATPNLRLTMNGRWVIECPGSFLYLVADRRAGQADMNATCTGLD